MIFFQTVENKIRNNYADSGPNMTFFSAIALSPTLRISNQILHTVTNIILITKKTAKLFILFQRLWICTQVYWKAEVLDLPTKYWFLLPCSNLEKPQPSHPSTVSTTQLIIPVEHRNQVLEGYPKSNTCVKHWHWEIQKSGTEHLCTARKLPWRKQKKTSKEKEAAIWPKSRLKTKHLVHRSKAWYVSCYYFQNTRTTKAFHSPEDWYLYLYLCTQNRVS